mmetsp:Transcript_28468/g.53522  ORF Transcript_28468/g.53522 Transcript_28468/m.53522 type:complete len:374 (-) Transcript_28468:274-1395(-)
MPRNYEAVVRVFSRLWALSIFVTSTFSDKTADGFCMMDVTQWNPSPDPPSLSIAVSTKATDSLSLTSLMSDFYLLSHMEMQSNNQIDHLQRQAESSLELLSAPKTATLADSNDAENPYKLDRDRVERVLDANTVQLKRQGVVRLAGVRMPSSTATNFRFPECFNYNPSYKLRQLLPANTPVRVRTITDSKKPPQVVLLRSEDSLVVNEELVRTGFAKVITKQTNSNASETPSLLDTEKLIVLQQQASDRGVGIFTRCDGNPRNTQNVVEAEFEPLERAMETVWGEDGGTRQLRQNKDKTSNTVPPPNPGDIKGCSDFNTYEDALQYFERYEPFYGDVARLDRDGDGVPCPGLPHTNSRDRYRMKVPKSQVPRK